MNITNKNTTDKKPVRKQANQVVIPLTPKVRAIKLGIDAHADLYVVVRIIDGGAPQPAQRFKPVAFLLWCAKQLTLADQVFSCYEAGPLGYGLHRELEKMGVTNRVVRPRDWDEYDKKVKTDQRDATALAECLDRYVGGNTRAFCVVRVPTHEEECRRSLSRQRQRFQEEKQRLAGQGRGTALYYGHRLKGSWWHKSQWEELAPSLPAILIELLEPLRRLIAAVELELAVRTKEVEAAAPAALPAGLGKLTSQILEREVADWNRFQNRRQVASYTGLCPREDTSSGRRFQGAITKHGNRRLRPVLVECMWRLIRYQPDYRGFKKWQAVLLDGKAGASRRKKAIVALARVFAVDWWRVRTGRVQAADLGLKLNPPAPAKVPMAQPEEGFNPVPE